LNVEPVDYALSGSEHKLKFFEGYLQVFKEFTTAQKILINTQSYFLQFTVLQNYLHNFALKYCDDNPYLRQHLIDIGMSKFEGSIKGQEKELVQLIGSFNDFYNIMNEIFTFTRQLTKERERIDRLSEKHRKMWEEEQKQKKREKKLRAKEAAKATNSSD